MDTIVYIDGFNLYYGSIRGSSHKWLDLQRLFERLRPSDNIVAVKYFTAKIGGSTKANQETYLRALNSCPKVEIIEGKFKKKNVSCRVSTCTHAPPRRFTALEEKRTDVNIAVTMIDDAYQDSAEQFILVSGDSDLVPAVNIVKLRFPQKRVIVYIPSRNKLRGAAAELRAACDRDKTLPMQLIARSQLASTVSVGSSQIQKPTNW